MSEIKRYDHASHMREYSGGQWVQFDDHDAAIKALTERAEKAEAEVTVWIDRFNSRTVERDALKRKVERVRALKCALYENRRGYSAGTTAAIAVKDCARDIGAALADEEPPISCPYCGQTKVLHV